MEPQLIPLETTTDHCGAADTTAHLQNPQKTSRDCWKSTETAASKKMSNEIRTITGDLRETTEKHYRPIETSEHYRKPTYTIGDKQTLTETLQTQHRPLQASRDKWNTS